MLAQQQLSLPLSAHAREPFAQALGDAQQVAASAMAAVIMQGGAACLVGPLGSGKRWLLREALRFAGQQKRSALMLTAAEPAEHFEGVSVLMLESLENWLGNPQSEHALFELANRVQDRTLTLITGSLLSPGDLPWSLPDLRSRLSQWPRLPLAAFDDDTLCQALQLEAERLGLRLEHDSVHWLMRQVSRAPQVLFELLRQLDRTSTGAQRRLSVPYLRAFQRQHQQAKDHS